MHLLTHFPSQLEQFGNLRYAATQRMEGKNGDIKKPTIVNWKNVTKTIAYQQEFKFVSKFLDKNWDQSSRPIDSKLELKNPKQLASDKELN